MITSAVWKDSLRTDAEKMIRSGSSIEFFQIIIWSPGSHERSHPTRWERDSVGTELLLNPKTSQEVVAWRNNPTPLDWLFGFQAGHDRLFGFQGSKDMWETEMHSRHKCYHPFSALPLVCPWTHASQLGTPSFLLFPFFRLPTPPPCWDLGLGCY